MQNYISEGDRIDLVATESISSGDLVFSKDKASVAITSAEVGTTFAAKTTGVFSFPKAIGAIDQGDLLYFDVENKNLTTIPEDNIFIGYAVAPALSADATVHVNIVDNPNSNIASAQADSVATTVPELVADFNALLAKLRKARIMAMS